jgi:hypothetical protein
VIGKCVAWLRGREFLRFLREIEDDALPDLDIHHPPGDGQFLSARRPRTGAGSQCGQRDIPQKSYRHNTAAEEKSTH